MSKRCNIKTVPEQTLVILCCLPLVSSNQYKESKMAAGSCNAQSLTFGAICITPSSDRGKAGEQSFDHCSCFLLTDGSLQEQSVAGFGGWRDAAVSV